MSGNDERKTWMGLLAKAPAEELAQLWEAFGDEPGHQWLRAPEAGGVMVRGRAGATGAPFNLGEMTVTRCSLKLESGEVGHGYVQGRDKAQARQAALVDALMQTGRAAEVRAAILDPLAEALETARAARAAKAAATKVDFFTMVRGGLMEASVLEGGFGDAAVEAARAFRMAMRVMARPGTVEVLDAAKPPKPVSVAAGTLLLTLCDHETGVYLAGAYDTGELREWLAFHTGAPVVAAESAQFALGDWSALMPLAQYAVGTPEYPDRSATLIVEMERLEAKGTGLRGPGIKERAELSLPDAEVMTANAAQFPLGVDFFLTCGDRVAGLPRSTKLEDGACT